MVEEKEWTDLNVSEDFIFVKWVEYGGDETYGEFLELPVYLHDLSFEFQFSPLPLPLTCEGL